MQFVPFCVPFACFPCVRHFIQQSGDIRASLQLVARNHPAINWRPVHVVTLPFTPRELGQDRGRQPLPLKEPFEPVSSRKEHTGSHLKLNNMLHIRFIYLFPLCKKKVLGGSRWFLVVLGGLRWF